MNLHYLGILDISQQSPPLIKFHQVNFSSFHDTGYLYHITTREQSTPPSTTKILFVFVLCAL